MLIFFLSFICIIYDVSEHYLQVNRHIEGDLNWGVYQWLPHMIPLFFDGMVQFSEYQCQLLLGEVRRFSPVRSALWIFLIEGILTALPPRQSRPRKGSRAR